jgi:pterin-4a-carbinolamine dehydratase
MAALTKKEIEEFALNLDEWEFNGKDIMKKFEFDSFSEALDFVNEIGDIVETENTIPSLAIDSESVHVTLKIRSKEDTDLIESIDGI